MINSQHIDFGNYENKLTLLNKEKNETLKTS